MQFVLRAQGIHLHTNLAHLHRTRIRNEILCTTGKSPPQSFIVMDWFVKTKIVILMPFSDTFAWPMINLCSWWVGYTFAR